MVHTILLAKQITLRIVTVDLSTALHMRQYNRKRKRTAYSQMHTACVCVRERERERESEVQKINRKSMPGNEASESCLFTRSIFSSVRSIIFHSIVEWLSALADEKEKTTERERERRVNWTVTHYKWMTWWQWWWEWWWWFSWKKTHKKASYCYTCFA